MTQDNRIRRRQAGYNLIEVMLAMAMLGVVTISIFTLFYMGRRNVYSGKQVSQAVAIATQVLEDMQPLNKQMLFNGAFGIAGNSAGTAFTVPPVVAGGPGYVYTNSKIRSTDATFIASPPADISTENTPPGLLTRWAGLNGEKLANASITLVLTPDQDPVNTPAQFATSQVLRLRVFVRWDESTRRREVVLDSVKAF